MLWDKGVAEFVNAAKSIKEKGFEGKFILVSDIDRHNSASVRQSQIDEWVSLKIINHLSPRMNIWRLSILKQPLHVCRHIMKVCQRCYEAASCAPVIAFDVAGSREIVKDGKNGFLVPFKDQNEIGSSVDIPDYR